MEDSAESRTLEQLSVFIRDLKYKVELFRTVKALLDVHVASDFNVFNYIQPDEERISNIIADLLDPCGTHGQGATLLQAFFAVLKVTEPRAGAKWRTTREHRHSIMGRERRIDILLETDGFAVGIENKPWAGEQDEQIAAYNQYLKGKYHDRYLLVYLSGNGSRPQSITQSELQRLEQEGKFKMMSYPVELRTWLMFCYKECKAARVRWFLSDFIDYIDRTFGIENPRQLGVGS